MSLLKKIQSPVDLKKLKPEELPQVCKDIRDAILHTVSRLGGHLGSSLGATELTVALHYVFNTPQDRIVWDTGHQTYGHKLLTGRQDRFDTIRQFGGLSGFLKRDESEYDAFGAGHASTAISAALGMAEGRDQRRENFKVVAVVSDGCMTGGMCYEAMQNAGQLGTDMMVVLNDNQMFISHRVGALGKALTRLLTLGTLRNAEKQVERFLKRFAFWGPSLIRVAKRAKVLLFPGMLFEELGFAYFGPVDGHDVEGLVRVLSHVKELKGPVFVHIVTKKGKGYSYTEEMPITYHGPGKFDPSTGKIEPEKAGAVASYTKFFSNAVLREADRDPRIVAITGAMPEGTGLDAFRDRFPKRYYDVGLAEEHAVTFAAGLACEGMRPVVAIYSTFLQRGYDQIMHDVCLQKLPVTFCLDRGGLVGNDGPTHHGVFDLSYLRMLPHIIVMAPRDENELQNMLRTALSLNGPAAIRYPRGSGEGVALDPEPQALPLGKGVVLREGTDLYFAAIGNRVNPSLKAAEMLAERGVSAGVLNMRFIKPIDDALLKETALRVPRIVTVEDNTVVGGFGSAVLEALSAGGVRADVLRLGVPDRFIDHGSPNALYDLVGLTPEKIAAQAESWLARRKGPVS